MNVSISDPELICTCTCTCMLCCMQVLAAPCVLIFEGGVWVWPGVEVGHVLELEVDDGAATRDVRPLARSTSSPPTTALIPI